MRINHDFSARAIVHGARIEPVPSPMPGVVRRMLDRIGDEVARATSIVTYAPESKFSAHVHTGGEEFLVLDGVFQDEHGDYPVGTYVRNPPTSKHIPRSEPGCTILVKLHQFDSDDRAFVRTNIHQIGKIKDASASGLYRTPLYQNSQERVEIFNIEAQKTINLGDPGGFEIFVLKGQFDIQDENFEPWSWLRLPPGDTFPLQTTGPVCLWIKSGHLKHGYAGL